MIPPQIGTGQIGSSLGMAGTMPIGTPQPGALNNPFLQQGMQQQNPQGQGQGNVQGVTPGQTPMNVQHPIAQLPQQKPGGQPAAASPTQGMQQAIGGLQKIMKGGQASPSQAQTASATPGAHQPQMPLNGNPQYQGADSAAQQSGMNPAAGQAGAANGSNMAGAVDPQQQMLSGGMGSGGLLGNGLDSSMMGGALDPNAMTGLDMGGMSDMGGMDFGGLSGLL